jgi:hypothetical protein
VAVLQNSINAAPPVSAVASNVTYYSQIATDSTIKTTANYLTKTAELYYIFNR